MKDNNWHVVGLTVGITATVVFILWLVIAGISAEDSEDWSPTSNDKTCYLHTEHVKNMWLTPGPSYTIRETLCKVK